jgi:TRAP-type C4-dicarboxylate transport system permease small subunit
MAEMEIDIATDTINEHPAPIDEGPRTTWVGRLYRLVEAVTVAVLAFYVAVIVVQVVLRYVFNSSLIWSDEIIRFGLVWNVMLGATLVSLREGHIRVDLFENMLPPRVQPYVQLLIHFISLAFLLLLLFFGWKFALRGAVQSAPVTGISMAYAYSAIAVGAALMALFTVVTIVRRLRALKAGAQ